MWKRQHRHSTLGQVASILANLKTLQSAFVVFSLGHAVDDLDAVPESDEACTW